MPKSFLLPALLLFAGVPRLEAQTDYYARLGVIGASKLMRDDIVSEITVRQSIAPMLALGASLPLGPGYRAGMEATFASGSYHQEETGVESDLGTLRTGSVMLGLEGPIAAFVRWRAGAGVYCTGRRRRRASSSKAAPPSFSPASAWTIAAK